jgi:hypothetical protein
MATQQRLAWVEADLAALHLPSYSKQYQDLAVPVLRPLSPPASLQVKQTVADVSAGVATAMLVAPFVSMIDKAVMKHAAGKMCMTLSLRTSLTSLFTQPLSFVKKPSFLLIWGVYSGTYSCANVLSSVCAEGEARKTIEFIGVSGTLASLNILKDRSLARRFGTGAPRRMPASCMALFAVRDAMTVFASFLLSPMLHGCLEGSGLLGATSSQVAGQMLAPMAMQWASSPLHLLGLNLYNLDQERPEERWRTVRRQYLGTSIARSIRIVPPFGLGMLLLAPAREQSSRLFGCD